MFNAGPIFFWVIKAKCLRQRMERVPVIHYWLVSPCVKGLPRCYQLLKNFFDADCGEVG